MDTSAWVTLFTFYFGHNSSTENERDFRDATGVHPEVAEAIYLKYSHSTKLNRFKLFVVLHYLKKNPTQDTGSKIFKFKIRKTNRKVLNTAVNYLFNVMDVVNLEDRFQGPIASCGLFRGIALVVDGTDCPIDRPNKKESGSTQKRRRKLFYSGRQKENSRYFFTLNLYITTFIFIL